MGAFFTAHKRPITKEKGHTWCKYVYEEFYAQIIGPEDLILNYATPNRDGGKNQKPQLSVCSVTDEANLYRKRKVLKGRAVTYIAGYVEITKDVQHTPEHKEQ